MVFPVLVMREHSPATFVWVLFWDLTRVYLFENKICDSVMILMCLLFHWLQLKWLSGLGNSQNIYNYTEILAFIYWAIAGVGWHATKVPGIELGMYVVFVLTTRLLGHQTPDFNAIFYQTVEYDEHFTTTTVTATKWRTWVNITSFNTWLTRADLSQFGYSSIMRFLLALSNLSRISL